MRMTERARTGARILRTDIGNIKWAVIWITACFVLSEFISGTICPVVCMTGFPCPACGLTRAGLDLLTLHFYDAWQMQPFIYPIGVWAAGAFFSRYCLMKKHLPIWLKVFGGVLAAGMVLYYTFCMSRYFPERAPYIYHEDNLIRKIVMYRQVW